MSAYHIGTEGAPWGDKERGEWRNEVNRVKRSYQDEVVAKLVGLHDHAIIHQKEELVGLDYIYHQVRQ